MTQIEQIKAEIERRYRENNAELVKLPMYCDEASLLRRMCKEDLYFRDFINSLPAEQPSEELEKEIEGKINEYWNEWFSHGDYFEGTLPKNVFAAYCHKIANWQREQMMKSAIDAKIVNNEMSGCVVDCEQGCLVLEPHTYAIGQKLKILIMEDEQ